MFVVPDDGEEVEGGVVEVGFDSSFQVDLLFGYDLMHFFGEAVRPCIAVLVGWDD